MRDKYADEQLLDLVKRMREARMEIGQHPLDGVTELLRQQSNPSQLKRLYGCTDHKQAAGRATHGDAFRMRSNAFKML